MVVIHIFKETLGMKQHGSVVHTNWRSCCVVLPLPYSSHMENNGCIPPDGEYGCPAVFISALPFPRVLPESMSAPPIYQPHATGQVLGHKTSVQGTADTIRLRRCEQVQYRLRMRGQAGHV